MKELSKVLKYKTPKSKIRELFDYAAGKDDVISLGIGQPDFDTPEPAIKGNIEALKKDDFAPNFEQLESSITEKTKAILINSPNNPTGYAYNPKEIEKLADIVIEHDLYLISDEVYEYYLYNGHKHLSPASLNGMFERTITTNAMSKKFSATGFRLGYVTAKKEIIDLMEKYHQYTVAGTNHAAQYGFVEALRMGDDFFAPILENFDLRRNLTYNRLKEIGFEVIKPKGAFYIMPSTKPFNLTGTELSEGLIKEKGVAVVPGNTFGSYSQDRLRISYATELEKIKEAMDRIEAYINNL
ncbi:MAG: aminotransferase class I/II-fold pyridoxal phosphate-dependent enzyme [Candidatus Lokiarchaeota archaeon]